MTDKKHTQAGQSVRPVSQSIFKKLEDVKKQVEFEAFGKLINGRVHIDPLYMELCLIIAEIHLINPAALIKVNGAEMEVGIVQEVYKQLKNDHIRLVFDNVQELSAKIFNKKAYLRTALYNAIFEIETHYTNLVANYE